MVEACTLDTDAPARIKSVDALQMDETRIRQVVITRDDQVLDPLEVRDARVGDLRTPGQVESVDSCEVRKSVIGHGVLITSVHAQLLDSLEMDEGRIRKAAHKVDVEPLDTGDMCDAGVRDVGTPVHIDFGNATKMNQVVVANVAAPRYVRIGRSRKAGTPGRHAAGDALGDSPRLIRDSGQRLLARRPKRGGIVHCHKLQQRRARSRENIDGIHSGNESGHTICLIDVWTDWIHRTTRQPSTFQKGERLPPTYLAARHKRQCQFKQLRVSI